MKVIKQDRLAPKKTKPIPKTTWGKPQYNVVKGDKQRIEMHRGCPWAGEHEYCYAPDIKDVNINFPVPEIVCNKVEILDMNFLARPDALEVIKELGKKRVNGKVVYYEEICGWDYRLLTPELADAIHASRFKNIRIAWDDPFDVQMKIKDAVDMFVDAGYKRNSISAFMIVNWRVPFDECLRKLDLMKVWGIKVCDCCYDGGYDIAVPGRWSLEEIKAIRRICRKHNQTVLFGIDPQPTINHWSVINVKK